MSKPFNFEEFKAGKPAKIENVIYHFIAYDEKLEFPLVVRCEDLLYGYILKNFIENATMLTNERTVWIAIAKSIKGKIECFQETFESKEIALEQKTLISWEVIDAIPYEIEE